MGNGAQARRLIRTAAAVAVTLLALSGAARAACGLNSAELRGSWGQARFSVEVADTYRSRARGLMNRETLPSSAGMLFIYDKPARQTFWMKNTLISLDMVFVAEDGTVKNVHHRAVPHDRSLISSDGKVVMVLEILGGLAERMGITAGDHLRHPAIDQTVAAWPCN